MTTPGEWDNRKNLLSAVLAIPPWLGASAAQLLGESGAALALAIAGTGGALLPQVYVAVGKYRAQAAEKRQLEMRNMNAQGLLRDVGPAQLGVDDADENLGLLPGGKTPRYVPRVEDAKLFAAVRAALESGGAGKMLIALGETKVGKSRALYEALRSADEQAEALPVHVVAPRDLDALVRVLDTNNGSLRDLPDVALVLWLNRSLRWWVNQGMTKKHLDDWWVFGGVVLATYGETDDAQVEDSDSGLGELVTLLGAADKYTVRRITDVDDARTSRPISDSERDAIRIHGLAAFLVAGPRLQVDLDTQCHLGGPPCPAGVAVVRAAVDWARCGRTSDISKATLRHLWEAYTYPGLEHSDDQFESGLEWATTPVAGTIALLEVASKGAYRAYDYAIELLVADPQVGMPPPDVWKAAIETTTAPEETVAVAWAAYKACEHELAIEAYLRALTQADRPELKAQVLFNLGLAYRDAGREDEALLAFRSVIDNYGACDPLRVLVKRAQEQLGLLEAFSRSPLTVDPKPASAAAQEDLRRHTEACEELLRFREEILRRFRDEPPSS